MITVIPQGQDTVRATFRLRCGVGHHDVRVVGEFNDWSLTANPMTFDGYCYAAEIVMPTGRTYRFRYVIDQHRWMIDWAADRYAPNEHGVDDSILDLTKPRASIMASTGSEHSTQTIALSARRPLPDPTNSV